MYVTRPLSLYKNSPEVIAEPPPSGPNSGYLVLQEEESTGTTCFGLCKDNSTREFPFPQNKRLTVQRDEGETSTMYYLYFIPVINQPLSSNRYYAIKADGKKRKGEAYASSTEEDKQKCCFCINYIKDQKPRPLDPNDTYQQFEFSHGTSCGSTIFRVKSVAPDAYPPTLLKREGWTLWNSEPKHFTLGVAEGLNPTLRASLPDFNFPLSQDCSDVVAVGNWYTPFMFIKEGSLKEQMKRSMFYKITLEQKWEKIFYRENTSNEGNVVSFEVVVPTQRVVVNGKEGVEIRNGDDVGRMVWFKSVEFDREETKIGLSSLVMERMIWEEERGGWFNGKENQVKVSRDEEYGGNGSWEKFGCYLLVESFVFERMDGSVALAYDFIHTHQVKIKWG